MRQWLVWHRDPTGYDHQDPAIRVIERAGLERLVREQELAEAKASLREEVRQRRQAREAARWLGLL